MIGNYNGRKAIVEQGIIKQISALFNDSENMARKNAHKTVEMISELPFGAQNIVNLQLIKVLVEKLKTEIDEIKVIWNQNSNYISIWKIKLNFRF